ncbi:MAG: LysM peptidoglycan-binding domain-containing protein [Clostridia bacterium]
MSVKMWLTYNNNNEYLQFPVNPAELSVKTGSANETVSVQKLGEVSIIQDPVLTTFDFSSHFPRHYAPFCEYVEIPEPKAAVRTIMKWKNSLFPARFIVSNDDGLDLNFSVTIETFDVREVAGDVGSLYFDISLRQYRQMKVRKVETKEKDGETTVTVSDKGQRPDEKPKPSSYTVKKGDNLWVIGRKLGVDHMKIANANHIKSPYTIYPNQVLVIP